MLKNNNFVSCIIFRVADRYLSRWCFWLGPSIKYVTLLLANFDPLPLSHFVTHPKSTSHISEPPDF